MRIPYAVYGLVLLPAIVGLLFVLKAFCPTSSGSMCFADYFAVPVFLPLIATYKIFGDSSVIYGQEFLVVMVYWAFIGFLVGLAVDLYRGREAVPKAEVGAATPMAPVRKAPPAPVPAPAPVIKPILKVPTTAPVISETEIIKPVMVASAPQGMPTFKQAVRPADAVPEGIKIEHAPSALREKGIPIVKHFRAMPNNLPMNLLDREEYK